MADFCKKCSIDTFGEDFKDLANFTPVEDWQNGLAVSVICEGCGIIQVDPEGNCVSKDCLCAGRDGHGLPWIAQGDGDAKD
jgi:hypothetical protein